MLEFNTTNKDDVFFITKAYKGKQNACECKISVNPNTNTWTISSWYTEKAFQHKGFGTMTLNACLKDIHKVYDVPERVEYIWNGANKYVLDWLNEHFGAVSKCPIAVQKYANDDDWESHIYVLNTDKFIEYFKLGQKEVVNG